MFVVAFAPEHNCVAIGVAVGVSPDFGVLLAVGEARDEDGLHWNGWLCERNGASDRLIEL